MCGKNVRAPFIPNIRSNIKTQTLGGGAGAAVINNLIVPQMCLFIYSHVGLHLTPHSGEKMMK